MPFMEFEILITIQGRDQGFHELTKRFIFDPLCKEHADLVPPHPTRVQGITGRFLSDRYFRIIRGYTNVLVLHLSTSDLFDSPCRQLVETHKRLRRDLLPR